MRILSYLFWPNPGPTFYENPKVIALLALSVILIVGAYGLKLWRNRQGNPVTKRLSRSWASASFWFGFTSLILTVSRAEGIQFLSMRVLWVVWIASLALCVGLQIKIFSTRYYQVLPHQAVEDPREKYLPKRKKH